VTIAPTRAKDVSEKGTSQLVGPTTTDIRSGMVLPRLFRVLAVMIASGAAIFSLWLVRASAAGFYRPDYSVFWTAAHVVFHAPDRLYDSAYMTSAQSWIAAPWHGPRPYAYPPSALIAFLPFSWMEFWPSFIAWNAVSLVAFAVTARPYARSILLGVSVLAPPTILSLISGQTALLVGAACMFGVWHLDKKPALAGLIMGLAAAIKPQALILAPLLLSIDRRALMSFFCGGASLVLISLFLGPQLWLDWIAAMPDFMRNVDRLGLVRWGATPATLAAWLHLGDSATLVLQGVGLAAAVVLAFWARKRAAADRVMALTGGAILCSPYAMTYDMVALMPVAATALFSETMSGFLMGLPLIGFGGITVPAMAAGTFVRRGPAAEVRGRVGQFAASENQGGPQSG
jgi:hypothetical protein